MRQLYGIDPTDLAGLNAIDYHTRKLQLLHSRKADIIMRIESAPVEDGYEEVQALNHELKYIDKAIEANTADLAELKGES
jgi:hypothetical protein